MHSVSVCVSLEQSMGIIGFSESNFEDNLQVQKKQTSRSPKHLSQKILRKMLASRQRETVSDFQHADLVCTQQAPLFLLSNAGKMAWI